MSNIYSYFSSNTSGSSDGSGNIQATDSISRSSSGDSDITITPDNIISPSPKVPDNSTPPCKGGGVGLSTPPSTPEPINPWD